MEWVAGGSLNRNRTSTGPKQRGRRQQPGLETTQKHEGNAWMSTYWENVRLTIRTQKDMVFCLLCPATRFCPFDGAYPRLSKPELLPCPYNLKRKANPEVKCKKSYEMQGVCYDRVDMIGRIPCLQ